MKIKSLGKALSFRVNFLALVLIAFSFSASAQVYQVDAAYGRQIRRYMVDTTLLIPTVCGTPTLRSTVTNKAAIAYDSCNAKFYVYNPKLTAWAEITGSGGSGGTTKYSLEGYGIVLDSTANTYTITLDTSVIANASTGGNTTIFETVLDSTGQPNNRVLFSRGTKISSSPRFLFDTTNSKLVINHNNISAGGANTKLFVQGNQTTTGQLTVQNVPTTNDTSTYKLAVVGADGLLRKRTFYPVISDPAKVNVSDTAIMLAGYQRDLIAGTNISIVDNTISASGGGSTDTTSLSNRINRKQQNLGWVNVMDYGADSTGTTNNSTAFTAALAALGDHGTLFIPKGNFLFTSTWNINKQINILGEGGGKSYGYYSATKISCATNIDMWKITKAGVQIEKVGFEWTGGVEATSARGILVDQVDTIPIIYAGINYTQKFTFRDITIRDFYHNIYIESSANWLIEGSTIVSAVSRNIHIENVREQDAGDWTITNCLFFQYETNGGGYGIYQVGSGGGKISNCKFNGQFTKCIYSNLTGISSIFQITNCSLENFIGGVFLQNVGFGLISNCQFSPYGFMTDSAMVTISSGVGSSVSNSSFNFSSSTKLGIKISLGANNTICGNTFNDNGASPYTFVGGTNNNICAELSPIGTLNATQLIVTEKLGIGVTPTSSLHVKKDQSAPTDAIIENVSATVNAETRLILTTDVGSSLFGMYSSTHGSYGILSPGNMYVYTGSSAGMNFMVDNASGGMKWATGGNLSKMELNSAGSLRLNAYGAGTATFDGSGNITSSSDRRIKNNIKDFKYGLAEVLKLRPRTFRYNADSSNTDMTGFIAQEVQQVIPGAVHAAKDKQGTLSLETNAILAALVNAVQELSAEVERLKNKIK